jgi:hypothetical protein
MCIHIKNIKMSNGVYHALWLNIPASKASRLLKGKGIRITQADFQGSYGKSTRGFTIQNRHYKKLVKVLTKGKTYTLTLNPEEILVNLHHAYHKVKIGAGFFDSIKSLASDAWDGIKSVGKKVYSFAQKVAKSPLGQAALKGIDLLAATEGVPPGLISGVTNSLLGVNNEPDEEEADDQGVDYGDVPEEDYQPLPTVHPKTGKQYSFPEPPSAPGKVPKHGGRLYPRVGVRNFNSGGAIYSSAVYSAKKAGVPSGQMRTSGGGSKAPPSLLSQLSESHVGFGLKNSGTLKQASNGRFMMNGRFISNADAQQMGGSLYLTR